MARARATSRIRGHDAAAVRVFGGLGTGHRVGRRDGARTSTTLIVGLAWLAIGIATYVVYRRRQGLSLTETHKVVTPKPVVEHEVEYESVLVAFEDGHYSTEAVATAVKLAARRRRGIHVLVTITRADQLADRRVAARAGARAPQR